MESSVEIVGTLIRIVERSLHLDDLPELLDIGAGKSLQTRDEALVLPL